MATRKWTPLPHNRVAVYAFQEVVQPWQGVVGHLQQEDAAPTPVPARWEAGIGVQRVSSLLVARDTTSLATEKSHSNHLCDLLSSDGAGSMGNIRSIGSSWLPGGGVVSLVTEGGDLWLLGMMPPQLEEGMVRDATSLDTDSN